MKRIDRRTKSVNAKELAPGVLLTHFEGAGTSLRSMGCIKCAGTANPYNLPDGQSGFRCAVCGLTFRASRM